MVSFYQSEEASTEKTVSARPFPELIESQRSQNKYIYTVENSSSDCEPKEQLSELLAGITKE
jgi:hypothetical protein